MPDEVPAITQDELQELESQRIILIDSMKDIEKKLSTYSQQVKDAEDIAPDEGYLHNEYARINGWRQGLLGEKNKIDAELLEVSQSIKLLARRMLFHSSPETDKSSNVLLREILQELKSIKEVLEHGFEAAKH